MNESVAEAGGWLVTEDGCLSIDDSIESVLYHPSLNVVMVTSKSSVVRVIDVLSGDIFHTSNLSADVVRCKYLSSQDRVVFVSKHAVGARRDLNGVLLLDSALQTPLSKPDDVVCIELPLPEAVHLYRCLVSAELPGVDYIADVLQELNKQIEAVQQASKHSHKVAKWATVCLKFPHSTLKTVFSGLLAELKRLQHKVPALPVAAAVHDRLGYLLANGANNVDVLGGIIDRALMYSELARRETFSKWPHSNYKWALPEPMAQAGFYYQPSSSGDDRAMCFTCNVCLVCWEPTDEPWSEHERHSPQCPFVKGEFTQNVPLSVTCATEPAQFHGDVTDVIECISTTTSRHYMATSTLDGKVVIWNVDTQLKKHLSFTVDIHNVVVISKLNLTISESQPSETEEPAAECSKLTTEEQLLAAVESVDEAGNDLKDAGIGISFSADDVFVSALSLICDPATSAAVSASLQDLVAPQSSLIVAATVFANVNADSSSCRPPLDIPVASDAPPVLPDSLGAEWCSNVQVLNRLNEALSGSETVQPDILNTSQVTTSQRSVVPCLIIYDVPASQSLSASFSEMKPKNTVVPSTGGISISLMASGGGGGSSNIGGTAEVFSIKDLDNSDDDYDVQIIGVTPAMSPPKVYDSNNSATVSSMKTYSPGKEGPELSNVVAMATDVGNVVQCIRLPCSGQYVTCVQPTADGEHVIVSVAPLSTNKHLSEAHSCHFGCEDSTDVGYLFVYKVHVVNGRTLLNELPLVTRLIPSGSDSVMSLSLLPADFGQSEDVELTAVEPSSMVVATTYQGEIKAVSVSDLSLVTIVSGDIYTNAIYCTGVDRLCASTSDNKLRFFSVTRPECVGQDDVDGAQSEVVRSHLASRSGTSSPRDTSDPPVKTDKLMTAPLLVDRTLTSDILSVLHDLTQFETLQPRFTAMVPPCWMEIQQEQQQRKHPQHLHQKHGDASQHTRTWRLQPDSTSWDEHLFELVLPKPCSIGHIDLKFCFNSLCTTPPNIQVTLLKQNIHGIGPAVSCDAAEDSPSDSSTDAGGSSSHLAAKRLVTGHSNAEVVCGPLDLSKYVDLSGTQGIVPLTGLKLLKVKSKSFLLHLKSKSSRGEKNDKTSQSTNGGGATDKAKASSASSAAAKSGTEQQNSTKPSRTESFRGCDWLQEISVTVRKFRRIRIPAERMQRFAMLESESFHNRLMMVACGQDDSPANGNTSKEYRQQQALDILCWITAVYMNDVCARHETQLAEITLLPTIQSNLTALVHSCLLEGDRSIAHKAAKLLALCLEYVKNSLNSFVALEFNYALLQSLLDSLPLTIGSCSAGALQWYFTLLNHIKCLDANATALRCSQLLGIVAQRYNALGGSNTHHAILRARYGLYGCPLDADLFDIDPPPLRTVPATASTGINPGASYASIVASTIGAASGPAGLAGSAAGMSVPGVMPTTSASTGSASSVHDDVVFKDLMNLCCTDNSANNGKSPADLQLGHYLNGLLEVEPLHFICHATSDGTRMERMDSAAQLVSLPSGAASGLSGTINFGESLSSGVGALSTLSTAMASAEQQLQQLQQKQYQLIKLQQQKQKLEQKLAAETSKSHLTSSSLAHYAPYTSELFPPTPKNTPFFMTPPVTPPNESYHVFVGGAPADNAVAVASVLVTDKPPIGPSKQSSKEKAATSSSSSSGAQSKPVLLWPQTHNLFQPPPAQALVIDRMHSGARRFVVLDFGKPILLTDVVIPMCGDLASLSIDIWTESEEVDGHRLVVSTDIGISSLIMNDIMPPPVCRYLKITTIRRYGGNTTRSRIPIGSFYGHTFMLPWEKDNGLLLSTGDRGVDADAHSDQSLILSQLNIYTALLEEVQCRYSLACKNLVCLLTTVDGSNVNSSHYSQFFLKRGKRSDEDNRIFQAYYDCCQLQVQLNLAKHAIMRLQKVLGIQPTTDVPSPGATGSSIDIDGIVTKTLLQRASVDKLRVITEFLLDTLLSMTHSGPTIPDVPASLSTIFTPSFAASLFRSLCVHGTRKTQTHAGVLLLRVCSTQLWWGNFLGDMLEEFFSSDQATSIFPQDRVFILLAALGQRSLSGTSASGILTSILALLGRLLSALNVTRRTPADVGQLDLSLIGWILLFLSKSLDSVRFTAADDSDRCGSKERDGNSRWNFVQGESGLHSNKLSSRLNASSKLYRRKLQKRLMHHKQQLLDLQQAKKNFLATQLEKASDGAALIDKNMEHMLKAQEMVFKKQIKQCSSKHLKDVINIRRTDVELLRRMNKSEPGANGSGSVRGSTPESGWDDLDMALVVSSECCLPVIHGLVTLLLSMDFTCHVDLFIIACKVLSRLTTLTRPAVTLSEALSSEELENLILLTCNSEYNHGNVSWGGAWASHSITCLLQDILDGERLYVSNSAAEMIANDNDIGATGGAAAVSAISDLDESLQNSCTLPPVDDDMQSQDMTAPDLPHQKSAIDGGKFDNDEMSILVDALMDEDFSDPECPGPAAVKLYYGNESDQPVGVKVSGWLAPKLMNVTMKSVSNSSTIHWGPNISSAFGIDDKKDVYKAWKGKLTNMTSSAKPAANASSSYGMSMAMDARLENGIELCAELRLKVMLSVEANNVQCALTAPLPSQLSTASRAPTNTQQTSSDDQDTVTRSRPTTAATLTAKSSLSSVEMLTNCFSKLFTQLLQGSINIEVLLQTWLLLNDDSASSGPPDASAVPASFDTLRTPIIAVDKSAVSGLLAALAAMPTISPRIWVLVFQTLSLVSNIRSVDDTAAGSATAGFSNERWVTTALVGDNNLSIVLGKFLSDSPVSTSGHKLQVGPAVVQAFRDFLSRLQSCCARYGGGQLNDMLLRLVNSLTSESGAFQLYSGPLDAQCRFLEDIVEFGIDSNSPIDVSIVLNIIESSSVIIHHHIMSQEHATCRSTLESSVSSRSCFSGLFASTFRVNDSSRRSLINGEADRDQLMCGLLKLSTLLVQRCLPSAPKRQPTTTSAGRKVTVAAAGVCDEDIATGDIENVQTDLSCISQSLGTSGVVMTSTPNVPTEDMPTTSVTDEQKTETKVTAAASGPGTSSAVPVMALKWSQKCSHSYGRAPTVADLVVASQPVMAHLIEALSYCNSNTIAMIFASSGLPAASEYLCDVDGSALMSVGDSIFQLLSILNANVSELQFIVKPLYQYLSGQLRTRSNASCVSRLSEPLIWLLLRVLDCRLAIQSFIDMGGIQVICNSLVNTNKHIINTSPSLISSIMQYFGSARPASGNGRRTTTYTDSSTDSSLQNFALLGTISSSSPSAGPPDVLIQGAPPHRRARTAAWSYHFYPDEAWVDLTITLPCAVLLKEVIIQPHLSSLATCPAAVTIEGSRDGGAAAMVPLCAPVSTSGLTTIKLQLVRNEVVTSVVIRLHKPRDSQTIGLSQIMLMGYMAFGDTVASASRIATPSEDYVSRTSIGWLRLLHHCMTQCTELRDDVTHAAAPTSDLLLTCTTLLMSSSAIVYSNNIETVLLTVGLHSVELGLTLIDHMLRRTAFHSDEASGRYLSPHGKIHGKATESTVEILYRLGTHNDPGLMDRIQALMNWLGDSARVALQRARGSEPTDRYHSAASHSSCVGLPTPAVPHVHVVAAILWQNHELVGTIDMTQIITTELLSCVYEWSLVQSCDSPLKRAIDCVLCSMCYVVPECFTLLLEWMGVVYSDADTDDVKDSQQNQPLTDDVKADGAGGRRSMSSRGSQRSQIALYMHEAQLTTLAVVCQSPAALRKLIDNGVISTLCSGLCLISASRLNETFDVDPMVSMATDAVKRCADFAAGLSSAQRLATSSDGTSSVLLQTGSAMTVDLLAPTLHFLAEIAKDTVMKDWLGQAENSTFWGMLLRALCSSGATNLLVRPSGHMVLTSEQQMTIEAAAIEFFSNVISCHAKNQLSFALVVCDVIQSQRSLMSGCGSLLSGFLRRLFLQVLLEDERVLVSINSSHPMYKGQGATGALGKLQHPKFGVGHCCRCLSMSVHSTIADVLSKVSEIASVAASDDQQKATDEQRKDASEIGIEVIDQISAVAAGLKAKEKRDKDKDKSSMLRPPGRRATAQAESVQTSHSASTILSHSVLPGVSLPGDLSLSQLLRLLYEQGLVVHGDTCIQLDMKQSVPLMGGGAEAANRDGSDDLMSAVSSDLPGLSSALQVFSSVNGLAMLAEHLPLLYPEFTRQTTPVDIVRDACTGVGIPGSGVGLGHDWVTVESAEEIYEEIYEPPMPPSPPSQHKPSTSQVLSIPPHSLVAFGLFLRLPGYAEVLLKEKRKAQCLLRLIFGVTDDGEGGHILMSPFASELPTLPFFVLKTLFDTTPLTTDDGVVLRRMTLDIGVVHLILACLSVLGHHAPRQPIPGFHQEIIIAATQATTSTTATASSSATQQKSSTEEKTLNYWAKGTGFGTGSTTSSWDAEHALLRQKSEEEHVTCFLQVLASYINPGGQMAGELDSQNLPDEEQIEQSLLPPLLPELLTQSCLVPALSSYLRNDSVLDMACHVPLYRALLELLRALATCPSLMPLLLPLDSGVESGVSVCSLLDKMKQCVDTYASRLKGGKLNVKSSSKRQQADDEETEGLALLIPDIQETSRIVTISVKKLLDKSKECVKEAAACNRSSSPVMMGRLNHSEEERYIAVMKELQFDTYKMVHDDSSGVRFVVPHHYESNVKAAGDVSNAARARRLAQEAVTLSTSLPLSAGSSVFVRCDEERLDIMKVLMTGPADTPYANGCFEFDVYFPVDYPNSPPHINLETTGNHTVRFNPNLYNDGKVCLSVLNTWHGRPEEKWNSQTSSFLQVLVSIQSLILVSEPYFNEPGYERSRGTPSGTASSHEYDANIRQATTKWAMLEMIRNPPACFKQVVEWHFWLKKNEILSQVEEWISDLESYSTDKRVGRSIAHSCASLKRHYNQLKEELMKLKAPPSDSLIADMTSPPDDSASANMETRTDYELPSDVTQSPSVDTSPTSVAGVTETDVSADIAAADSSTVNDTNSEAFA